MKGNKNKTTTKRRRKAHETEYERLYLYLETDVARRKNCAVRRVFYRCRRAQEKSSLSDPPTMNAY